MASEYRPYSDFPHRALPLWSWPDLSHLMFSGTSEVLLIESIITDAITPLSVITDSMAVESIAVDSLELYSIIL